MKNVNKLPMFVYSTENKSGIHIARLSYGFFWALLLSVLLSFSTFAVANAQATAKQEKVSSQELQSLVDKALRSWLKKKGVTSKRGQRLSVAVSAPDSRLQLSACATPPNVDITSKKPIGRVTTKVSCEHPKPWSLYIPAQITLFRPVVVSTGPIARHQVVTRELVRLQEKSVANLTQGYYTRLKDVVGMNARRAIGANQVINVMTLTAPNVVSKGDEVVIIAEVGSLKVRTPGIALSAGKQGQQINVRNKQSQRVIKAKVIGQNQVQVL